MSRFTLRTGKPVAVDSPDHLFPFGTKRDNFFNRLFNRKMEALFGARPLRILDMGCSGGGFVKSCLDGGHAAIGLEGSDYSQRTRRAEWATIPQNLFTCDITAPFTVEEADGPTGAGAPAKFDVITAWEVIEHIRTPDLPGVCRNVDAHLADGGIWIMSVCTCQEVQGGMVLHQTVQPKEWWLEFFASQGFTNHPPLVDYFGQDWVRGPLQLSPGGFHVVLMRKDQPPPPAPQDFALPVAELTAVIYDSLRLGMGEYALYLCEIWRRRYPTSQEIAIAHAITALVRAFLANPSDVRVQRALAEFGVNIQTQPAP